MTLIERLRHSARYGVSVPDTAEEAADRLEAAEKLVERLALSLRIEAEIYTENDPEDGPPEHISEALASAKRFMEGK